MQKQLELGQLWKGSSPLIFTYFGPYLSLVGREDKKIGLYEMQVYAAMVRFEWISMRQSNKANWTSWFENWIIPFIVFVRINGGCAGKLSKAEIWIFLEVSLVGKVRTQRPIGNPGQCLPIRRYRYYKKLDA